MREAIKALLGSNIREVANVAIQADQDRDDELPLSFGESDEVMPAPMHLAAADSLARGEPFYASPEIRVGCLGARRGGFTLNRGSYWWAASLSHSPMAATPAAGGIGPEAPPFLAIRKVRVRSRRRDRRHTQPQLVQLFLLMTAPAVSDLPTQNSGEP